MSSVVSFFKRYWQKYNDYQIISYVHYQLVSDSNTFNKKRFQIKLKGIHFDFNPFKNIKN